MLKQDTYSKTLSWKFPRTCVPENDDSIFNNRHGFHLHLFYIRMVYLQSWLMVHFIRTYTSYFERKALDLGITHIDSYGQIPDNGAGNMLLNHSPTSKIMSMAQDHSSSRIQL